MTGRPADELVRGGGNTASADQSFVAFIRARPSFLAGYVIVAAMALLGLAAPILPLASPVDASASAYLQPPSWAHPMGTDIAGLDVFSRVLHAPRIDLMIALASSLLAALIGGTLGALAGLWQGRGRLRGVGAALLNRSADVIQAFPLFALALVLVAVLGQGPTTIIVAIAVVNVPICLRLMRAEAVTIASEHFVEAARIAGASDAYLLRHHVLPNAAAPLLAQIMNNTAVAVLLAAGLSFLGAGVRAPTPEWGSMIAMGFQNVVTGQWWPSIFPGIALALTIFGLGRIAASIQAWSNPHDRMRPTPRAWAAFAAAHGARTR